MNPMNAAKMMKLIKLIKKEMQMVKIKLLCISLLCLALLLVGCDALEPIDTGEVGRVTRVIDGDTIEVDVDGVLVRVRYVGINTPERDETCYTTATQANATFVEGKTVRMVRDTTDNDRFGRRLRYIYVDDLFVNRALIEQGFAEAVLYEPDDRHYDEFLRLEREAAQADRGCHPTGIFDDGDDRR